MAKTSFNTSSPLVKKLIAAKSKDLFEDVIKESVSAKFMGTGSNNIIQWKKDLENSPGDRITFGLVPKLSDDGWVEGTQTLEGNEESLKNYDYSVNLRYFRAACRDDGALTRQRSPYDISEVTRERLKVKGVEKIDRELFKSLSTSPTAVFRADSASTFVKEASDAAAATALTAADEITPAVISAVKTWAMTGGNRSQPPLRPIMFNGKRHYVLFVSPEVAYGLRRNGEYILNVREAEARASDNPLFSGAIAMIDGVVVHETEYVENATNATSITYSKNFLVGAQALCMATAKPLDIVTRDFDYGDEMGVAIKLMAGFGKPTFNGADYGAVGLWTARTNIA